MQTVSKKNVQLTIEELEKQNESFIAPDNIDRTNLGRDKANIKLYGTTIVNLLGKYGSFETDSNEDGLADGWTKDGNSTASRDSYRTNGKVQKLYFDNTGGSATTDIYIQTDSLYPISGDTMFLKCNITKEGENTETNDVIVEVQWYDDSQVYLSSSFVDLKETTIWSSFWGITLFHYYGKLTIPANTAYFKVKIVMSVQVGNIGSFTADNILCCNLSAKGDLDPARVAYYSNKYSQSVTKWEELEEDDLTVELPYVDSVATIGLDKVISIKNLSKNLFSNDLESNIFAFWNNNGPAKFYNNGIEGGHSSSTDYICERVLFEAIPVEKGKTYTLSFDYVTLPKLHENDLGKPFSDIRIYHTINPVTNLGSSAIPDSFIFERKFFGPSGGEGKLNYQITAQSNYIYVHINWYGCHSWLGNFQIEEGDTATDYEPPRTDKIEIPAGTHLFGLNGAFDSINLSTGTKEKRWEKETEVSVASGSATLSKSGIGTAILIGENGVPYEGTVSGTSLTTSASDGTYTVWYQLATPEMLKVLVTSNFNYLGREHNQIFISQHKKDTFIADGVTKTFNLSSTALSTSCAVKIAGQTISGVTKTTSSITFSVPPRRNEIIEVIYDTDYSLSPGIEAEVLKTNGTTMDVKFLTDISITEQEEALDVNPKNGPRKHAVRNRGYELSISKDLIEAQNNLEYFRDKTFRVKIYNSRDGTTEYLSPCTYKQGLSKDWISGSESVVILAGDYYDNA